MTIVTTTAICLLAIFAFLFGRSAVISNRRGNRVKRLTVQASKLSNRLNFIEYSSKHNRHFDIEEDRENGGQFNVILKVTVREAWTGGESIQCIDHVLIKSFRFENDKDFARREAEELLEKLNEN